MRLVVPAIVVHELYTAAFGLYVIWLVCRAGIIIASWVPLGLGGILEKLMIWTVLVGGTGLSRDKHLCGGGGGGGGGGTIHTTKLDRSQEPFKLRSIQVCFEKMFTLVEIDLRLV